MSSSKHTLNTCLLGVPVDIVAYPLNRYHMLPLSDEDIPEYVSGSGKLAYYCLERVSRRSTFLERESLSSLPPAIMSQL